MQSKQAMIEMADHAFGLTRNALASDNEVILDIADYLRGVETPSPVDLSLVVMLGSMESRLTIAGLVKWAAYGYPQYVMGHKYVAALLVTGATEEAIDQARPPFDALVIDVPNDILFITDPKNGHKHSIQQILVSKHENSRIPNGWGWAYTAYTESGLSLYRYGVTASELLPPWIDDESTDRKIGPPALISYEVTDHDKQTMSLIGRLIINTCLSISDPTKVKPIGKGHDQWKSRISVKNSARDPYPHCRTFQVGTPVKHDFREHVRAFARGERSKLSVQSPISGHYKMQPHGPQHSLRKLIWLEPYWRGPEDAPIPLRPHVFPE